MTLAKNDFVEVQFRAFVKGGELFDSNDPVDFVSEESKKKLKPVVFSIGSGMFLKGVEDFLIGKELGKYEIELSPEQAFGARNSSLVQLMPMQVFQSHNIRPIPGVSLNFDGKMGKILSVSGGRVTVDFNNPLAGKTVHYSLNVLRKLETLKEKIESFHEFLFQQQMKYTLDDSKITLEVEKQLVSFVELFKDKYKELFNLELEVKAKVEPEKSEKVEEKSQ